VAVFDGGADGEGGCNVEAAGPASLAPQSPQNLAAGGFAAPQRGQDAGNGEPHAVQNFVPGRSVWWHRGHSIGCTSVAVGQWSGKKV
jgi:hypothetical protein